MRKPALGLFAVAATGLSAWWLDRQQQAFGEEFAMALMLKHPELRLEESNFDGELAAVELVVSDVYYNRAGSEYVEQLGTDIRDVFCAHARVRAEQLEVRVFHVSVLVRSRDTQGLILSHTLSSRACA